MESEILFKELTDKSMVGIYLLQDNLFKYVNPMFAEMLGYGIDEVIDKMKPMDFVYPEDRPLVEERIRIKLSGDVKSDRYEFRIITKKRDIRYAEVLSSGTSYNGRQAIIGTLLDITERKEAEKVSSDLVSFLRTLINTIPSPIFCKDINGIYQDCNKEFEIYTGLKREEIIGKSVYDLYHKNVADKYHEMDSALFSQPGRQIYEYPIVYADGNKRDVVVNKATYRNSEGAVAGLVGVMVDITARKHAEEALHESEELYRTALENSNDGVMIVQDGRYVYMNQKLLDTIGRRHDELIGQVMGANVHPEDMINILDYYDKYHQGLPPPKHFEARVYKSDGRLLYTEISPVEVIYRGKKSILAYVRNITDRKRAEEERLKINKLESVGLLAGGIAHDFNNLLTTLQGYIDLVRMDVPAGSKACNRLTAAEKSIRQATELTGRLITFAKGGDPIKIVNDIGQLVKDAVLRSIVTSTVKKNFYLDSDLWPAEVDERQISQVVGNLAINAVEAMPQEGVLTVKVKNETIEAQSGLPISKGNYIKLTVEDTGTGIPADDLPLIFDPYFSTKQRGAQKGMGLGLSVCHSVVGKHKGCITIESQEGIGTSISVYLPAASDPPFSRKLPT